MEPLSYQHLTPALKIQWWQLYLLGALLFAMLHGVGLFVIIASEPAPGESNALWTAVGPDGDHEPTVAWLNYYELPMANLFDRYRLWSKDHIADYIIVSGTNGMLWGFCVVAIFHVVWAARRKIRRR